MNGQKPATNALSGKRQFLVHIDASLIRRVKILAIDRNVTASSVVQEALLGYLATEGDSPPLARKSGNKS